MSHLFISIGAELYRFIIRQLYVKDFIKCIESNQFESPNLFSCKKILLKRSIDNSLFLLSSKHDFNKIKGICHDKILNIYPEVLFRKCVSKDIKNLIRFYNEFNYNKYRVVERNISSNFRLFPQYLPFSFNNDWVKNDISFITFDNNENAASHTPQSDVFYKVKDDNN